MMKALAYIWILSGVALLTSFLSFVPNLGIRHNYFVHEFLKNSNALNRKTRSIQSPTPSGSTVPLKVFILVGQSNMQGHGYINKTDDDGKFRNGTLEWMVESYPETYGKLKTSASSWKESDDVWIAYNRQSHLNDVRPEINQHGKLIPGYGGDPGQEYTQMGPELGFGWTIGDAFGDNNKEEDEEKEEEKEDNDRDKWNDAKTQQILLLKVAWGGKSLAVDFRPPSSGGTTGLYYEAVMATIYKTLTQLPNLFPGYNSAVDGYDIAGFAWHQGWNDGCDVNMTLEYEYNLANLIRDVRTDLAVPDLPISIGVSGMSGWTPNERRDRVINAQFAVANSTLYPEFKGTVASVETRNFFRPPVPASPGNQVYHWNNNCESYWLIGQAMGEAMVNMIMDENFNKRERAREEERLRRTNNNEFYSAIA